MRALFVLLLAGCISKGTDIPPVQAGSGLVVDAKTQTISIDPAKVPMLPACAANQLVKRISATEWTCVDPPTSIASAANADTVDSRHANEFLLAGAQAVDSASLGGLPATSFLSKDASDTYYLEGELWSGGHTIVVNSRFCLAYAPPPLRFCVKWASMKTSINGVFCGATTATAGKFTAVEPVDGTTPATGYRAAKIPCETTCGSEAAHACSGEELARSGQLNLLGSAPPQMWFGGGPYDCSGWTQLVGTGWIWLNIQPAAGDAGAYGGSSAGCSASLPIACCL